MSSTGDCAGVVPNAVPAARTLTFDIPIGRQCGGGGSDGDGRLALESFEPGTDIHFYSAREPDGSFHGDFWAFHFAPLAPQPHGWQGVEVREITSAGGSTATHFTVDGEGVTRHSERLGSDAETGFKTAVAPVPAGGSVVLYDTIPKFPIHTHGSYVQWFAPDGTAGRAVQVDAAANFRPDVLAIAVSTTGSALALAAGVGPIGRTFFTSAWVHPDGTTQRVSMGGHAGGRLELFALADGAIAVRVDGAWVGEIGPGATALTPAPAWLSGVSGDARIALFPGARGNAVLPAAGTQGAPCDQRVELRAPSGTLCGTITFRWADASCTARSLDLGLDGTVIQQSPQDGCASGTCSCTHAWWPAILR